MTTAYKYLLIGLSSIIGVLLVVLRIQGGQLHQAQIQLLKYTVELGQYPFDKATNMAKDQFKAALRAFYESK